MPDAKAAAARELVVDKVERPAGKLRLNQDRGASSYRLAVASAFARRQPLLAIEPVNAVDAGGLAFGPQQDEEAPIAEPAPLIGKLTIAGMTDLLPLVRELEARLQAAVESKDVDA